VRTTNILLQMALQPGVGLGLLYNMPPGLSIPCSVSPFVYTHLSQAHGHVIQPSHLWSSFSSCCIQLSVHFFFLDCGVLHSFYTTKPSYSLAFNKPDNVLSNVPQIYVGQYYYLEYLLLIFFILFWLTRTLLCMLIVIE